MEYMGYMASIAMGVILGLMGGGGSILTVPILIYFFAVPPVAATGFSLFVVGLTALIGCINYLRKGDVDFATGIVFAIPSVIGVNVSRGLIIPAIPAIVAHIGPFVLTKEILVMITFAILMISASYSMIQKRVERSAMVAHSLSRLSWLITQGIVVGMVSGFVGAGGGFLIIPSLVFVGGLPMRRAIGTSLTIIAIQSILGFMGDVSRGLTVNWPLLVTVALFAMLGITAGSTVAHKVKEQKLKVAFGWFVLVMGCTILLEQIYRLS